MAQFQEEFRPNVRTYIAKISAGWTASCCEVELRTNAKICHKDRVHHTYAMKEGGSWRANQPLMWRQAVDT